MQVARKSLLGQYFTFLKTPDDHSLALTPSQTVRHIWRLYSLHLLLLLPMALVIQLLSQWIPSVAENAVEAGLETLQPHQFLFLAVVFAPISEELVFRLPLRFSRVNWSVPLLIISLGLSAIAAGFDPNSLGRSILTILIFGIGFFIALLLTNWFYQRCKRFLQRHLRAFIFLSSIIFGLIHVSNYPQQAWVVAPFLVLPQTTLGFLLAYIRIRLGFKWAIFTHALHNFLVSSPVLFMWMGSDELKQQLLDPDLEVPLPFRDQLIRALMMGWTLVLASLVILTAIKLLQEWRKEQAKLSR